MSVPDPHHSDDVGILAAGVAHEVNNPLAFVLANLSYALDQLKSLSAHSDGRVTRVVEDVLDALDDAVHGGERVKSIVQTLTTYAGHSTADAEKVDVRTTMNSALDLARTHIRQRARLVTELDDVGVIEANGTHLLQVFVQLLLNAAEAIPTGSVEGHEVHVSLREHNDGVRVIVQDTGEGIDPSLHERIFEPFITQRSEDNKSGLGLSFCLGVVDSLGGRIDLESEVGNGATFRIWLPRWQNTSDAPGAEPRRGRVLVIDDEPLVSRAIRRVLGRHHDIDIVDNGRAGFERIAERPDHYDVILCDLLMPEMTGMELYRELLTQAPGEVNKMVFLTGAAAADRAHAFLDEVPNPKLDKPFEPSMLRELVGELASKRL